MRARLLISVLFAWLLLGCETQPPYAECELDIEVTAKGVCAGSGGVTSCVVKQHPTCVHDACLSFYSSKPFCTTTCVNGTSATAGISSAECGVDSFCWTFRSAEPDPKDPKVTLPAENYCVPNNINKKNVGK